ERLYELLDGLHNDTTGFPVSVVSQRILGERLAQAPKNTIVVHNDPAVLPWVDTVCASDGLHEGMRLHRLYDGKRGKAFDIEACFPHSAYNCSPEPMLRVFKSIVHRNSFAIGCFEALLHDNAVRNNVDTPFFEVSNLVLCFAYDDFENS